MMRYLFFILAMAFPAYAGLAAISHDVAAQWAKYQSALKANDLATLTSMAKFPIRCNEFKGNIKSAKDFEQQYKTIFPEPTKSCFQGAVLEPQKAKGKTYYEASCDVGEIPIRFIFEMVGSKLCLTTIDNVNE